MVSATFFAGLLAIAGSGDVTLLQFTADWCAPCQSVKPTVQRLSAAGYPIQTVNVDRQRDLVSQFRVTSVPCFILVSGGREIERVTEAASYSRLVQMFERAGVTAPTSAPAQQAIAATPVGGTRPQAGLPRPLASLARNLGKRRDTDNDPIVQIESGVATPQPTTTIPGPATLAATNEAVIQRNPNVPTNSSPRPATNYGDMQQSAMRSTVRLRIDDLNGHSVGTGTIIDIYQSEALIVTCGHIFRDSSGKGRVAVDLFTDSQAQTVNGTLIGYDLERDIGFIAIPATSQMTTAKVAPQNFRIERGQTVFSVGCDRGADPTVRASRITGIDRYVGPPNIEIAGQPTEGRSGGGLFSEDGQLIGVCNAADPTDNEGIFASLPAIHWELDRIGQSRIYSRPDTQLADTGAPRGLNSTSPATAIPVAQIDAPVAQRGSIAANPSSSDTEVICIVRSRANPQGTEQVFVLDRPSPDLLNRLASESKTRPVASAGPPREPFRPGVDLGPSMDHSQVIRAQSD